MKKIRWIKLLLETTTSTCMCYLPVPEIIRDIQEEFDYCPHKFHELQNELMKRNCEEGNEWHWWREGVGAVHYPCYKVKTFLEVLKKFC